MIKWMRKNAPTYIQSSPLRATDDETNMLKYEKFSFYDGECSALKRLALTSMIPVLKWKINFVSREEYEDKLLSGNTEGQQSPAKLL